MDASVKHWPTVVARCWRSIHHGNPLLQQLQTWKCHIKNLCIDNSKEQTCRNKSKPSQKEKVVITTLATH